MTAGPAEACSWVNTNKSSFGIFRYERLEFTDTMVEEVSDFVVDIVVDSMAAEVTNDMSRLQ